MLWRRSVGTRTMLPAAWRRANDSRGSSRGRMSNTMKHMLAHCSPPHELPRLRRDVRAGDGSASMHAHDLRMRARTHPSHSRFAQAQAQCDHNSFEASS
jgi:hypothetical protein